MSFTDERFDNSVPCKDCQDREPACHDRCEKYLAYKKELKRYKDKWNIYHQTNRMFDNYFRCR